MIQSTSLGLLDTLHLPRATARYFAFQDHVVWEHQRPVSVLTYQKPRKTKTQALVTDWIGGMCPTNTLQVFPAYCGRRAPIDRWVGEGSPIPSLRRSVDEGSKFVTND